MFLNKTFLNFHSLLNKGTSKNYLDMRYNVEKRQNDKKE